MWVTTEGYAPVTMARGYALSPRKKGNERGEQRGEERRGEERREEKPGHGVAEEGLLASLTRVSSPES